VFGRDGALLLVDEGSLELVKGATVDFQDEMMRSAFAVVSNHVVNPTDR
jgi:iron-sulfur cluster assembly 2